MTVHIVAKSTCIHIYIYIYICLSEMRVPSCFCNKKKKRKMNKIKYYAYIFSIIRSSRVINTSEKAIHKKNQFVGIFCRLTRIVITTENSKNIEINTSHSDVRIS
jgi:hypothetical protein